MSTQFWRDPSPADDSTLASILAGGHPLMRKVREDILRLAREDCPVLISGETGTGKRFAALALHERSRRAGRPPVVVPAGTLLGETAASLLLGHVRGAFTGADSDHAGYFLEAHESDIVVEDIPDLNLLLQALLLRVTEERVFRPVGGSHDVTSNFRLIATANRRLQPEIDAGRFRSDLYYRLADALVLIPPLREHRSDIPIYVERFTREFQACPGKRFDPTASDLLHAHRWPGNVRELRQVVRRALLESTSDVVSAETVARILAGDRAPWENSAAPEQPLLPVLKSEGWNKAAVARKLGIARTTLDRRLKKQGIIGSRPEV